MNKDESALQTLAPTIRKTKKNRCSQQHHIPRPKLASQLHHHDTTMMPHISLQKSITTPLPLIPHRKWTSEEIVARNFVVVDGMVYDVRAMIDEHPSGPTVLKRHLGTDITRVFHRVRHSNRAKTWLTHFCVGQICK